MGRWFSSCLVFCVVLALACLGQREILRRVPGLGLEEEGPPAIKARHYRIHRDEIDLLFVGSSRVYRQLNPAVFDARLAELGHPTHSYNFGLPGVRFYELLHLVDWLLETRSPRLRWLFLELGDPEADLEDANLFTRRNIGWHAPGLTWIACRNAWESERPLGRKLGESAAHLGALLFNLSNAGCGVPAVSSLLNGDATPPDQTPAGCLPAEYDPTRATRAHREEYLARLEADPELLRKRVDELLAPRERSELSSFQLEVVRALVARIRDAGVEPIFLLLPPADRNNADWLAARASGALPDLFAYDDPRRFDDFYLDPELRFDLNHLLKAGGNRLTRSLAEDFARHLEAGERGEQ